MARDKPERLLNLTFMLLSTSRFLPKDHIRRAIGPYREAPSEDAFERMFERDKEELRALGIDIETGSFDAFFDDEQGYRIRRDTAELPEIELTPEEAAAVGVAANVWQHPGLAGDSSRAVVKLKAAGLVIDPSVLSVEEPRLAAEEPAFDTMLEAATTRRPVAFRYQRPGQEVQERQLQPWGVLSWRDRWYVGGYDVNREEPRLFRISRVRGSVAFTGPTGSYEVPADANLRDVAAALFPPTPDRSAILRVAPGRAHALRATAVATTPLADGRDEIDVPFAVVSEFAAEIASYGDGVVVVAPADLQDAVITHLREAIA
ncbi:MAG TPA: WYL domain-containing protein [Aeromicrobium sp.]|nr:WYL domain-containing protein [Aeromicrobium sp.]